MALFKIEKGLAADLSKNRPKVHDGWCYFTTDDGKFYIDIANDENAVLTNYPGGAGNRVPLNAFYADRVNFIPQIGAGHDKTTGELHLQIITGKKYDTATNTVVDNASGYLKLPAASKGKEGILSLDTQFIGGTKVLTDSPVFADGVKLATKNTLTGADFTLDKVSTCKYVMSLAQQTNVNTGNLFLYSSGNNNLYHNSSDNQILTQKTINDSMIPWGGNTKAGLSPIVAAASYLHSANRIQFAKPAGITVEYSQNNGTTWTDYGLSNADKVKLVSGLGSSVVIGKRSSGVTIQDKVRITMNATSMGFYTAAKKILFNITTNGAQGCTVLVEKSTIGKPTEFTTVGTYPVDGWSGWNAIPLGVSWGGSASQTSQVASFRFTFGITSLHTNTSYKNTLSVLDIMLIGDTYWTAPSNMAKTGHLYAWDESQNATFPAGIKATTTLQVSGASTLSSVTATSLTVSGNITSQNITSAKNDTYTLGTSSNKWKAVYATSFVGDGAFLTNLAAANLTGTIADANLKEISSADKTYGSTSAQTPSFDGTFLVPYITVDKYGRVTNGNTASVALPKYDVVTASKAGLMSSDMLATLNKINVNAEVNQNAFSQLKVGNSTYNAPGKTSAATFAGKNLTATLDTTNGKITYELTAGGIQTAIGGVAATEGYVNDAIDGLVDSAATDLNTIGKLAAAIGSSTFLTTLNSAIDGKVSKSGDTMTNKLTISAGGLAVTGASSFANNVTLSQQLSVSGTSSLASLTVSGATTLLDTLTVKATSTMRSITPEATNTYNLGATGKVWKTVYATTFSGSGASLTNLNATELKSGTVPDSVLKVIYSDKNSVTYGKTSAQSPGFEDSFNIPYVTVDKYGRVTSGGTSSVALPKYSAVTTSADGLMTSAMLTKLNGIAAGAEVNQNAFSQLKVGTTTYDAPSKSSVATFAGKNLAITLDNAGKITYELTAGGIKEALGDTAATETYVSESIAALVDSAPDTLNTLGELAIALKSNPDVVKALEDSIATKVSKAGDTMTNKLTISAGGLAVTGTSTFANKVTLSQQLEVTGATTLSSVSMSGDLTTSGNIAPTATNLNLGSSAKPWANVYGTNFSGNAATATSANNGVFYVEGNTTGTEGTWTGTNTNIPSLYKGLTIAYKIGIKGLSSTEKKTTLALTTAAGTSGNIAVYRNNSQITTHLGVNTVVLLVYDGTCWRWADYDSDAKVTQTVTASSTTAYPMIFKYSSATTTATAGVRFASTITATPAGTITSVALNAESITASQSLKVTSDTDVTVGTSASGAVQITGGATIAKHLQAIGKIYVPSTASQWIGGMDKTRASIAITTVQSESSYHPYLYVETFGNHVFNLGGINNVVGFNGYYKGRTDNLYDWRTYWDVDTGKLTHTKDFKVSASTASTSKASGAVVVTGGVGVGGSLYANAVDITTTLVAAGAATLKSSLSVTSTTTLKDTLDVQNTATMRAIKPNADSTYDFGTSSIRWKNGYFDVVYTPDIKENLRITGSSADVPLIIRPASGYSSTYLKFEKGDGTRLGSYGFSAADTPVIYMSGTDYSGNSKIVHEKNQATLSITVKGLLGSDDTTINYKPLTAQTLEINPDAMFHKYSFNKSTTFSTAYTWYNTGIAGDNMATGAYLISLSIGNDQYIGTMSWYAGSDVGSTDYDEIVLHKAGKASAGSCFYLRTKRTSTTLSLQISSNKQITTSTSYTITARKLL